MELICSFFVASWTGVVKYHGPRPSMRPKQVFLTKYFFWISSNVSLAAYFKHFHAPKWLFASVHGLNRFLWPIILP